MAEIAQIERADAERAGRPQAQRLLAREVTRLVHGQAGLEAARRISDSLFSGETAALSEGDLEQLRQDGLPSSTLPAALPPTLTQLLSDCGMATSGKPVKDALQRSALRVNSRPVGIEQNGDPAAVFSAQRALFGRFYLARLGKKKYHLFERV